MKKSWIFGIAALVVVMGASFALAATPAPQSMMGQGMDMTQMGEFHQQMVEQHVKDGVLTPEQAKSMNDHMTQMGSMMNSGIMGGNGSSMMGQGMMKAAPQQ
ncbi:hypothetical protein AXX12_15085 [Anaerosporomusa subterranea]|uniref:DUF2680 domain-containing protein n=1 Tax=Anaerosporomusa subterranea TaxID=1794912 RepID=A0A154BLQ3_ANASB|nr:DUF2680 domain-containing protein [Anaerosporomusa subterranea]KYZ74904.1 hypothetical protein AXX12_15085 [Anaerosporomusa subterranea]